ncbi:2-dehydro-3-deoxyphosphogluconate aldolase [Enterococcus gilvus]|uniref:2-dehydro-3-deoxyphosphogluconate aldolase n=1 Tax=Enterococcus gilvus TaxID=160453 RepID=UPI001C8BD3F2|nr:2-dehydro-3-deoxyphosphogluconate aldolase [Enterococcus gilvus]MBX8937673.1 2-dehydro-3-deoxyphosphogluconate aldolase [Enterococcus gilvus]
MTNKFELEHIGINTENTKEAEELAALLSSIFNLTARHGQKSEFAGDYFECMRSPFLGKNGHIAMRTPDLENAVEELKRKGLDFNLDTAAYDEEGKLKNIYLAGEFGGFAIHILRK